MTNRLKLFLVSLTLVLGGLWLRGNKAVQTEPVAEEKKPVVINPLPQRLNALTNAPRAPITEAIPSETLTPECRTLWGTLRAMDLSALQNDAEPNVAVPSTEECKVLPPDLSAIHNSFVQNCKFLDSVKTKVKDGKAEEKTLKQAQGSCYGALLAYRSVMTDWLTKDKTLKEISDPKVLTDKLLAQFSGDPSRAADVADRLLEIDPSLAPVSAASAIGRFHEVFGKSDSPDTSRRATFEAALERAKNTPGADTMTLAEMEVVSKIKFHDNAAATDVIEELRQTHPESGMPDYLAAGVAFKSGKTSEVPALLERAITLEKARNGQNPPTPFLNRLAQTYDRYQASIKLSPTQKGVPPQPAVFQYAFSSNFGTDITAPQAAE